MDKIFVVTAVDHGDTCDGKARVLGAFKSKTDAIAYVRNDMEDTCDYLADALDEVDFDKMLIMSECEVYCQWSIDEVEVK